MGIGQMSLAWGIARHKRMIAGELTKSQKECAARYGALLNRHFVRLNETRQKRVLDMVPFFMDV